MTANGTQRVTIIPCQQQAHRQQTRWPRSLSQRESWSELHAGSSRHWGNISPVEFHFLQQLAETRKIINEDSVLLGCNAVSVCNPIPTFSKQVIFQSSRADMSFHSTAFIFSGLQVILEPISPWRWGESTAPKTSGSNCPLMQNQIPEKQNPQLQGWNNFQT